MPTTLDIGRLAVIGPAFATLAAVLLPATALAVGWRMAALTASQVMLAAGVVLCCALVAFPRGALAGNLWLADGIAGNDVLAGSRDAVIGDQAWALTEGLAWFAGLLLAALVIRWVETARAAIRSRTAFREALRRGARGTDAPLLLFVVAYVAGLVTFASVGTILDRYLFPLVPAVAIVLLRGAPGRERLGRSHAFGHGALAWLAVSAFVMAANSFAYDAARWREGETLAAMGYDAATVDAGYEWVGYHASGAGNADAGYGITWYDDWIGDARPCAVVSNSPVELAGFRLIAADRSAYREYLFLGPDRSFYLYGAVAPSCPTLPAADDVATSASAPTLGSAVSSISTQGGSAAAAVVNRERLR